MTDSIQPRTVVGLKAENFKRLVAVELHPTATGLVELRGRNGQGKSSVLDAIAAALGGARACPTKPIRDGESSAEVVVDLGDLIARRRWTDPEDASKNYLTVESKDGAAFKSPQAILDRLTGGFADPVEFQRLKPADQVRAVLGMVDLGIDLDASKRAEAEAEQERLMLGREGKALAGEVEGLKRDAAGAPAERVSVTELSAQLEAAHAHNGERVRLEAAAGNARREAAEADGYAGKLEAQLAELEDQIQALERQFKDLNDVAIPQANAALAEAEAKAEAADAAVARFEPVITTAIQQQIARAEATNRHADAADRLAQRAADLVAKMHEYKVADQRVQQVRQERRDALEAVTWPVDGMGYDPDGVTLTLAGVPLAQASQAEQLRASAELAMAQDPPIRVMLVREGSLLDAEHKAMLADLVAARGYQLWIECVADGPTGVGFFVDDGVIA